MSPIGRAGAGAGAGTAARGGDAGAAVAGGSANVGGGGGGCKPARSRTVNDLLPTSTQHTHTQKAFFLIGI